MILAAALFAGQAIIASTADLGTAAGRCRAGEAGPAFEVDVLGLEDRIGRLKLELYPANDADFLADDNVLVAAGKPFARVEIPIPPAGPVRMCIRAPRGGPFALSLLHDRNGNRRFDLASDGIGFSNNPRLGWSRPKAASAQVVAGTGSDPLEIRLNYRSGLFSFGPVGGR